MHSRIRTASSCALPLVIASSFAFAADIDLELEAGIGQTDNITRATDTPADPAFDDVVYSAGLALTLEHDSARADVDLRGSLFFHDYKDGPYDNQTLPALDLSAIFRVTDQVLSWLLYGNVGQQAVDPFQPVTPDNFENITYFTTGPRLQFLFGPRFSLRTDLYYSEVKYEVQPADNSRAGAQLSFIRQINPNRSLSLNLRGERTEFDLDALFSPVDRLDAFIQFVTEGSRNNLTIDLGISRVEREDDRADEPLVNIEWRRQVSQMTSFNFDIGTGISDGADGFRNSQSDSTDIGDVQNQQGATNPFRQDYAGLAMMIDATRTSFTLGGRWSTEEYAEAVSQQDRDVQAYRAVLTRQLGRFWVVGLHGHYDRYDYSELAQNYDLMDFGASLTWRQLRTLEVELRVDHFEQESTDPTVEYVENRVYLAFRYVPQIGR